MTLHIYLHGDAPLVTVHLTPRDGDAIFFHVASELSDAEQHAAADALTDTADRLTAASQTLETLAKE